MEDEIFFCKRCRKIATNDY